MAKLEVLVREFSRRYQVEGMDADEEGGYTLTFDAEIEVRCFERFDSIYLVSTLEVLPGEKALERLRKLLNYALMRMKSGIVAVGLDAENQVLLHTRFESQGLQVHEFEEKLEQYVNEFEEYSYFMSRAAPQPLAASQMIFKP